jgi:hypothetical protein
MNGIIGKLRYRKANWQRTCPPCHGDVQLTLSAGRCSRGSNPAAHDSHPRTDIDWQFIRDAAPWLESSRVTRIAEPTAFVQVSPTGWGNDSLEAVAIARLETRGAILLYCAERVA